jgi:Peptidase family M50
MRRGLLLLLPTLAYLAVFFGGQWLLGINIPQHLDNSATVAYVGWLLTAFIVGTVAHELGHALAVRLAGGEVLGITLGGKLASVTFRLGTVPVSVGLGVGGSVNFRGHRLSAARRAAISAAGPAASVLVEALCLLLPVPRWEAFVLALAVLASAAQDLAPGHVSDGTTDGYKLLQTRARLRADAEVRRLLSDPGWQDAPNAADILINGFRLDVPEAEDCLRELGKQPDALLRLYLKPWTLPDQPEADVTHIVHVLSWKLLASGDLPAATVDLAACRIEWVIDHLDKEHPDTRSPLRNVLHTLALARLRQRRPQEVQRLCAGALAADIDPDDRATVLATVAMARHALLLSGRQQLDEALALDPDAELVSEAARFLDGGWETALAAHGKRVPTPDTNRSLTGHERGRDEVRHADLSGHRA